MPYNNLHNFYFKKKIYNFNHWRLFCKAGKRPQNIPRDIRKAFKSNTPSNQIFKDSQPRGYFISYKNARDKLIKLGIKNKKEFNKKKKNSNLLDRIPHNPYGYYKNKGWKNWLDFFGKSKKKFAKYSQAKKIVKQFNFKSSTEWFLKLKKSGPINKLPNFPEQTYRNKGWKGWRDFLGTG